MKKNNTTTPAPAPSGAGVPEYGKQYRLTGGTGTPCVANGNTWAESEVLPNTADRIENDEQRRELEKGGK